MQWQWAEPELSFRLPQDRVHARTAAQVHAGEVVGLKVEELPDTVEALLTEPGALGFEVARSPEGRTVLSWIAGNHHRAALNAAAVKKVAKIGDELLAVGGASLVPDTSGSSDSSLPVSSGGDGSTCAGSGSDELA